jgi:hypothetical protein
MKIITDTGNPDIVFGLRPSAVTSAGSGRPRALAWLSAMALAGMLSACAIDAPSSARTPSTGIDEPDGPGTGIDEPDGPGTCAHPLCQTGGPLDPTCDSCVAHVCAIDDFCCTVLWDIICVEMALEICNCGIGCAHDLCETGVALDPTCDPCVETVCQSDPSCCSGFWTPFCVAAADDACGLECFPGEDCEHPLCERGTPLDPTCSSCVAQVCDIDGFCCEVEWDQLCVDIADEICDIDCATGCQHGLCEASGPLDPGCDPCVAEVCTFDPFCCGVLWDPECVNAAQARCDIDCGDRCHHELCEDGVALEPTCDPCVAQVCAIDASCCDFDWTESCVDLAAATCGLPCGCDHGVCEAGLALDPAICDPCVAEVCNYNSFCCNVQWDSLCVEHAVEICGRDCGAPPCAHDPCEIGVPLFGTCDPCVAQVCAADWFCCDVEWDAPCAGLARDICGLDCGRTCAHGLCVTGDSLDPACDPCAAQVCAADFFCCDSEWDSVCVDQAEDICGLDCGGGGGTCEHDLCETGVALDPTCDPCVAQVCAADSFCCEVEWDSVCVGQAEGICGLDCGGGPPPVECGNGACEFGEHCLSCPEDCGTCPACPHDVCDEGVALPFGCNSCTPNVCKVDSFCCEVAWDSFCVALVPQHCARPCE